MSTRYRGTCAVWARHHTTPRPGYMVTPRERNGQATSTSEPTPAPEPVYATEVSTLTQRELNDALARRLGLDV